MKRYVVFVLCFLLLTIGGYANENITPNDYEDDILFIKNINCNEIIDNLIIMKYSTTGCQIEIEAKEDIEFELPIYLYADSYYNGNKYNPHFDNQVLPAEWEKGKEKIIQIRIGGYATEGEWAIHWRIIIGEYTEKNLYNEIYDAYRPLQVVSPIIYNNYKNDRETSIIETAWNLLFLLVGFAGAMLGSKYTSDRAEKRMKKERILNAYEDINQTMQFTFRKLNEAANIQPKTNKEYEKNVLYPREKFEESFNKNSIWLNKKSVNSLRELRLAFRQVSRAIMLNLPQKEIGNTSSFRKKWKIIDWENFTTSFTKAENDIKNTMKYI